MTDHTSVEVGDKTDRWLTYVGGPARREGPQCVNGNVGRSRTNVSNWSMARRCDTIPALNNAQGVPMSEETGLLEALKQVIDPELMVNIVTWGSSIRWSKQMERSK